MYSKRQLAFFFTQNAEAVFSMLEADSLKRICNSNPTEQGEDYISLLLH